MIIQTRSRNKLQLLFHTQPYAPTGVMRRDDDDDDDDDETKKYLTFDSWQATPRVALHVHENI